MATPNDITLTNEFGEKTMNKINEVNIVPLPSQATLTVVANLTAGSAVPSAVTTQALANKLPSKAGVEAITAIAVADAPVQTGLYVQADVQAIADLANANKAKINEILAALKVVS